MNEADGAGFVVELKHFSGPLDLLLTLLREEQIDIYDIPIAHIAEQFLKRIQALRLDEAADYLEMAARLLRIKAQMLLPRREGEDQWDDPRAELVRRLLEYQQIREVVDVLEVRAEERRSRFAHPPLVLPPRPTAAAPLSADLIDLLAAVDRVLRAASRPSVHAVVPRALDVAGALEAARAILARRTSVPWSDLVGARPEPWQVLSVLLALLELARLGECVLRQPAPFGNLEIARQRNATASQARGEIEPDGDHDNSALDSPSGMQDGDGLDARDVLAEDGLEPVRTSIGMTHDPASAAA